MQLLDIAFVTFFASGLALFVWFVVLGAFLVFFTPKHVKRYAFNERHFSEVELAISSGFHFGALIYGVGLIASVCFPLLGRKRGLIDIRSVCRRGFVYVCVFYTSVMLLMMFTVIISMITWLSIS
ncbi:hypothetical protein [Vibrio alfacsensis]|uniref:hypothetical protein n=1 Tax=Vibrio alfacsensis TaxID=1074311 RepID=UPI0040675F84